MNWLVNLSATMPYMVAPGNHESECHIALCQIEYSKYGHHLDNFTAYNKWALIRPRHAPALREPMHTGTPLRSACTGVPVPCDLKCTGMCRRWRMPYASSGGALNMWYSFNYGLVHFVSLNTETDFPTARS